MVRPETIQKYSEAREQIEAITLHAMALSEANSGREVDSWRPEYGSYIFAKVVMHAMSILRLAPDLSGESDESVIVWDPSSLAALVRSLIDSYFVFYYVACDEVGEAEEEFRHLLWAYHGEKARLKNLELIKSTNQKMAGLRAEVDKLRSSITEHPHYKRLSVPDRKAVRQGRYAFLLTNSEICDRAGFSPDHYKSTYDFLSSYIHALPFSLSHLAGFYDDQDALVSIYKMILNHGSTFLAQAVTDFAETFGDAGIEITPEAEKAIGLWRFILHNVDKDEYAV